MLNWKIKEAINTTDVKVKQLERLNIHTVRDLLLHFPRTYSDDSEYTSISNLEEDQKQVVKGFITQLFTRKTQTGKHMTRGILVDEAGDKMEVLWFNQPHLKRMLHNNMELILNGKPKYQGKWKMISPAYEPVRREQIHSGRIVPVYPETEGLSSKWIREKMAPIINDWLKHYEEFLPEQLLEKHDFISISEAIKQIHFPESEEGLKEARRRLAYNELFLIQLKVLKKKLDWQKISKKDQKRIKIDKELSKAFIDSLPFELTKAQKQTIKEIIQDLQAEIPMCRLIQGDVGSGKTVVAAFIALLLIKNGYQVALMAPTAILAKQHLQTMVRFLTPFNVNIQFITGSTPKKAKEDVIQQMKTGRVDMVIGTHALIQDGIGFKNLGLAIIDEQHRFGVKQRTILKSFGSPHLLSLSATPIPRTLAITIYGDQDLSIIDEMPKGRQAIITNIVPEKKRIDAYRWIENQVAKGRQAYVICPLIESSESESMSDIKAVTEEYDNLRNSVFPSLKVGLLHGKLKAQEKEEIMKDFSDNKINILVATSVVEVGIDVANATIMLIEGAERFGLSQLHQFRGRVGRGEHQSYCFLFTSKDTGTDARKRLNAMKQHISGFKLAEIDMELRGPGEIYGIRQSGIPDMKMASLTDSKLIATAREDATKILKMDPSLNSWPNLVNKLNEGQVIYLKD